MRTDLMKWSPFHELMAQEPPAVVDGHVKAFAAAKNPRLDTGKITHFAMGIFWKALYHRLRYSAGQPDGFQALKTLVEENPDSHEPLSALSICFYHFREYEKSAEYALKAAQLATGGDAIDYAVSSAKALRKANKPQDALKILLEACKRATQHDGAANFSLRKEVYGLLKDIQDSYMAFAIAEWALHENLDKCAF